MKIASIVFGTDSRGISSGVLGYTLKLTGGENNDFLDEIAKAINLIEAHPMSKKYPNLFINSDFADSEYETLTMLKAFKDRNFRIHITTSSVIYHSFYVFADYLKLHLYPETVWAGFQCNEVVYHPSEDLTDPELPEFKMLYSLETPLDAESKALVLKFLSASRYSWNLVVPVETKLIQTLQSV